jgi:dTDP-4-dehydrorhamnose reductase
MNKVLITGSGGFIGKYLYNSLLGSSQVVGVSKSLGGKVDHVLNLADGANLEKILNLEKPNIIVHNAAYSNVEGCEADHKMAELNNITAVNNLVSWAKLNGCKIIFISTDYVYDGVKGHFTEADKEHPLQYYGQTKLEGERLVAALDSFVILRTTVVYGWDMGGKNFFMQMYNAQKNNQVMNVPIDQISNPTSVIDLVNAIKAVILNKTDVNGIFIATGNEFLNRYEFAMKVCEYFGWNKNLVIPRKTAELGQLAKRPLNNSTVNKKFCEVFNFKFMDITENFSQIKKLIN